jgi:hypothetical protein
MKVVLSAEASDRSRIKFDTLRVPVHRRRQTDCGCVFSISLKTILRSSRAPENTFRVESFGKLGYPARD